MSGPEPSSRIHYRLRDVAVLIGAILVAGAAGLNTGWYLAVPSWETTGQSNRGGKVGTQQLQSEGTQAVQVGASTPERPVRVVVPGPPPTESQRVAAVSEAAAETAAEAIAPPSESPPTPQPRTDQPIIAEANSGQQTKAFPQMRRSGLSARKDKRQSDKHYRENGARALAEDSVSKRAAEKTSPSTNSEQRRQTVERRQSRNSHETNGRRKQDDLASQGRGEDSRRRRGRERGTEPERAYSTASERTENSRERLEEQQLIDQRQTTEGSWARGEEWVRDDQEQEVRQRHRDLPDTENEGTRRSTTRQNAKPTRQVTRSRDSQRDATRNSRREFISEAPANRRQQAQDSPTVEYRAERPSFGLFGIESFD